MEQAGVQLVSQGGDQFIITMDKATKATNGFVTASVDAMGRLHGADGRFLALGQSAQKAGDQVEKSAKGFDVFGEIVTGALRKVGEIAVDALGQAAKATTAFLKGSIDVAGDFEAGMLDFQAVAGKDVDTKGLDKFHDLFIQLGKELPVSTSDVEQAAIEMVKGGIDPAIVAAGGLRQNIQFAAAAMDGDLVEAANVSAKILGGWADANATAQQKAEFLTHATNQLTKAANASSVDVHELSLGIFNAQGIAKTAGVSFDDLTTTLAALSPRFASSSEAGNSLKNVIARLQPTTKPAIAAMEGLGLITADGANKFYDAQGSFIGFEKASQLLQDSLKGLTDQQKQAVLQTIFGNDAMNAASGLAELGASGYQHMADALASANGVAENAALKQQGYNTALENAKGSVEALQITIGSALLPVITDLLNNYIAPGINSITAFADSFSKMIPAIMASDDPLQTFLNALKVAAPGLLDIITTIEQAKDSFIAFATPIADVVVPAAEALATFIGDNLQPILFGLATAITVAVVPAIVAATTAFLSAAAPIVALVAAGALLYKAWETDFLGIKTTVTAFWTDTLLPAFTEMQAWLAEKIPPAIATLATFWTNTLLPALKGAGDFLQNKVFPILSDLADVWLAAASAEVEVLAALWTNVLWPALKIVWSYLDGVVIPVFHALFDVEFAIAAKVVEALAGLWQKVLWPALKSVGEYISSTVIPTFQDIGSYLSQTFGPALASVSQWLGTVTGGFNGVSGAVKGVINWIEGLADSISKLKLPDWLTPGSPTPWEIALYGIGKALSTSVAPGLKAMQGGMTEIAATITETFQNSDIIDALTDLGKDAIAGFGAGLKNGLKGVISVINSTADTVEGAFKSAFDAHSPSERMIPVGESITQGIMEGISALWPQLADTVSSLSDDLISQFEDIGQEIQSAIADAFGATASIDRQIAKNFDKLGDISDKFLRDYVQQSLDAEQKIAESFADPKQGAAYFKMMSENLFETAALRKKIAETTDMDEKARLNAQLIAISRAQEAERAQFFANLKAQGNALQDLIDKIGQLFNNSRKADLEKQLAAAKTQAERDRIQAELNAASLAVNDTGPGHDLMLLLDQLMQQLGLIPRRAGGGPVKDNQPYWVGEHGPELFWPTMDGMVSPAASSQQMAARANQTTYNGQVGNTYNMPIYTNNSPGAIQQSWAIVQASMP